MEKAATTCGLGSESVWQIAVDNEGRMIISGRTRTAWRPLQEIF